MSEIYQDFTIHLFELIFVKNIRTRKIIKLKNNNNTKFLHEIFLNIEEKSWIVKDKYTM